MSMERLLELGMNVVLNQEVAPLHLNLVQAMPNPLPVLAIVMTINNMGMCPYTMMNRSGMNRNGYSCNLTQQPRCRGFLRRLLRLQQFARTRNNLRRMKSMSTTVTMPWTVLNSFSPS